MRRLRLVDLVPLNACMARNGAGGEWRLLLWVGRKAWWAQ